MTESESTPASPASPAVPRTPIRDTPRVPVGDSPPPAQRGRGPIFVGLVLAAVIAAVIATVIGWRMLSHRHDKGANLEGAAASGARSAADGQSGRATDRAAGAGERATSVVTAPVVTRDVPIYLDGIGNVVPLKTVVVRPQVDGRLDRVAFTEGRPVRKGEVLAQIDPRPFANLKEQAEATMARDKAQLRSIRLTLERYEAVRKENLIAQQQVDDQRALVQQLEATIQSGQAQVDQAKLQLDYARIRSPIDGVTGIRLVDPGNIVRAADPTGIVVVTQLDPIAVLFSLPQDDLPRIATQMAIGPLRVDVLSRDEKVPLGTGELALIDNQINQATASIRLKAILPNGKGTLWPNQFVKARLLLSVRKQALVVPAAAIQRGPQGTFVYAVGADDRAVVRPVKVDSTEGDTAILSEGVRAGEAVVIEGQGQLRPGARVTQKRPDEAPHQRGSGDRARAPK